MKANQLSRDKGKNLKLSKYISNDHLNSAEKSPIQKLSLMSNMHFNFFSWNATEVIEQKIMNYAFHSEELSRHKRILLL